MSSLKPYPAYKDSGVQWLGEVPAHWEVRQLGRIGRLFKGNGGTKADQTSTGTPCVRYGDLYTKHRFHITESRSFVEPVVASEKYTAIQYGDVLFAGSGETIGEIGKSAVNLMRGPACCGGDVIILRPQIEMHAPFAGYATGSGPTSEQKSRLGRGFTVMHIYATDLKYASIAMPPLHEQIAIARFLGDATSRIDRYIRSREKLLRLLEEQKQALVHEAVTGRVDVRTGKPYPSYKDSGAQWLGKVPTHWEVLPNRSTFCEVINCGHSKQQMLSVTIAQGVIRQKDLLEERSKKDGSRHDKNTYKLVEPGDIAYNKMRAWQGAIGVSQHRGIVSPAYIVQRPRNAALSPYLHHLLRTRAFAWEAARWSYGITSDMWSLRPEHFKLIYICLPPLHEQIAIARFLDDESAKINESIANARCQTKLLKELRTRLIADVVTGKLDVR